MTSRVRIVPAQWRHINVIAYQIREIDAEECRAMGRTPKQALRLGLQNSDKAWSATIDGRPVAMFGVVVEDLLSGIGTPWLLGTDELFRLGRDLLLWAPPILRRMGENMRHLQNYVSADNDRAIRLLRKWGFMVSTEAQFFSGVEFLRFSMSLDASSCPSECCL